MREREKERDSLINVKKQGGMKLWTIVRNIAKNKNNPNYSAICLYVQTLWLSTNDQSVVSFLCLLLLISTNILLVCMCGSDALYQVSDLPVTVTIL